MSEIIEEVRDLLLFILVGVLAYLFYAQGAKEVGVNLAANLAGAVFVYIQRRQGDNPVNNFTQPVAKEEKKT